MQRWGASRRSLAGQLLWRVTVALLAALLVAYGIDRLFAAGPWPPLALGLAAGLFTAVVLLAHWWARVQVVLRALETSVDALQDGDFSFGLRARGDELDDLVAAHNRLGRVLREQRQNLMQRELMLDTVVQASPLALLLFDPGGYVVMANLEARRLFAGGRRLEGTGETVLLAAMPAELAEAVRAGREGLLTVTTSDGEETVHLSVQTFTLNARPHRLLLIKHLTREISRQEVATWKKVIRVISHELNNSLGPMQSLTRSGLREVGDDDALLKRIFETIGERTGHLLDFLQGYVAVAKLPAPVIATVEVETFLDKLAGSWHFSHEGAAGVEAKFDPVLLEQALINLLKNAAESGSAADEIRIHVESGPGRLRLDVLDRGSGMSGATLEQAVVPFYSTKRTGSGVGLALVREIVDAHGGRFELVNRRGGGVRASLVLPI